MAVSLRGSPETTTTLFIPIRSLCLVAQLYPTLCDPMDCSLPGPSVHGILQARILEWIAISSPGDLPDPGIEPMSLTSPALAGRFFTTSASWEAHYIT